MSVYSGKSSDSTLWEALKRRITRKGRRSEKSRELKRDRDSGASGRSFESLGYERHELQSGSEIYLATLDEDLFFEYDEPKPISVGNKFADEDDIIESEIYGESFINSPCFAASPQVVTTSSTDTPIQDVSKDTDFEKHSCKDSEYAEENPQTEEHCQTEVERLPAAPSRIESESIEIQAGLSEVTNDYEGDTAEEQVVAKDSDVPHPEPLLYSRRFPELMSPVEILALPQEIEFSTTPRPPAIILLPEATDFGNGCISVKIVPSGFDHPISASTSDTEYDSKTSLGYDVMSDFGGTKGQVTATSTSIEKILVDYADFAGYDFLPELTDPVRREPRHNEYTVSPAYKIYEMEDEVFGVMMLTLPELASDAFEMMDSVTPGFEESVEDVAYTYADAENKLFFRDEEMPEAPVREEMNHSAESSVEDNPLVIDAVPEDSIRSEKSAVSRETVSDYKLEASCPDIKPKISFMFGGGAGLRNFY